MTEDDDRVLLRLIFLFGKDAAARGLDPKHGKKVRRGRRARFYKLTRAGRKQVEAETGSWQRLSGAVDRIIAET